MKQYLCSIFLVFASILSYSSLSFSQNLPIQIEENLSRIRSKESPSIIRWDNYIEEELSNAYSNLSEAKKDSLIAVRRQAYIFQK